MTREVIILLVGGYGHVGKLIAERIKESGKGIAIIAGRDVDKARNAAKSIDRKFLWAACDIEKIW